MSKEYVEETVSQFSLHINVHGGDTRGLNVYYSVPEQGVNDKTGILLLIPGYGGHANSNVYKKMRRLFPDRYNLIVVQCDYFGWEFMQGLETQQVIALANESQLSFSPPPDEFSILLPVRLQENLQNFNDMGPMQIIDLMNAFKLIMEKYPQFDRSKVIAYGHSHGAYLSLLANILMPGLFSAIIDISAMLYPVYMPPSNLFRRLIYPLTRTDNATGKQTKLTIGVRFDYLIAKINQDTTLYDLRHWYKMRNNSAHIISFQGADDTMVPPDQKKEFLSKVDHATCVMVDRRWTTKSSRLQSMAAGRII